MIATKQRLIYFSVIPILILLAVFCLSVNIALSQGIVDETGFPEDVIEGEIITIATINIYNASIVSRNGNEFNISFDLSNRKGLQPKVKYGIQLIEEFEDGSQAIIDTKIFQEEIYFAENTSTHKEVIYKAPEFLNGSYQLWVISENTKGLLLALSMAGNVELNSTKEFIEILVGSCFVQVEGEVNDPHYSIVQGVDINAEEKLITTCDVVNHFKKAISFSPSFKTLHRSQFGKEVEQIEEKGKQMFTLNPGQRASISFYLPIAREPQAYDINATFQDVLGNNISSTIIIRYVLRGQSATIQNLTLDKDFYSKGEKAKLTFLSSLASDAFPGSRAVQGTSVEGASITIQISDDQGESCAMGITKQLTELDILSDLEVTITKDCHSPVVTATIEDSIGNVLDSESFVFLTDDSEGFSEAGIFIIIMLVIFAGIVIYMINRRNRSKLQDNMSRIILLLVIFIGVFSTALQDARADTFTIKTPDWVHFTNTSIITVNLNKPEFAPNETITISAASRTKTCGNNRVGLKLTASYNGADEITLVNNFTSYNSQYVAWVTHTGQGTLAGPSSLGDYVMKFTGKIRLYHVVYGWTGTAQGSYDLPFSVKESLSLGGSCSVNQTVAYDGDEVTWTANATGGGGGAYTYTWTGTDGLAGYGSSNSVKKIYSLIGVKTAQVDIRSGSEVMSISCSNSVTINPKPQCSDKENNDDDTKIDEADPDCWTDPTDPGTYDPNDNNESGGGKPQCSDGVNNDFDTLIDEKDPGCWTDPNDPDSYDPNDNNETDVPQCFNGRDDDENGCTDFIGGDTGCTSSSDMTESGGSCPVASTQCSDTIDNADPEDTVADTADPGCYDTGGYNPADNDETDTLPQCSNFFDDDGDGLVDYKSDGTGDPGCSDAGDNREFNIGFQEI